LHTQIDEINDPGGSVREAPVSCGDGQESPDVLPIA
jgi:hypothetical protein